MPRTAMVWTRPTVKVATTQAGLAAGEAVECQITSAVLTPATSYSTIPATGCSAASQSPSATAYSLDLAWLQDWSDDPGLSRFAWDNDALPVWVQVIPNAADATGSVMEGEFFCASGGYGATFGDGSAAATTASWPAVDKPTIGGPTGAPLADADPVAV